MKLVYTDEKKLLAGSYNTFLALLRACSCPTVKILKALEFLCGTQSPCCIAAMREVDPTAGRCEPGGWVLGPTVAMDEGAWSEKLYGELLTHHLRCSSYVCLSAGIRH